jgi:hypothetical protein
MSMRSNKLETPNTLLQTPNKNFKFQAPNPGIKPQIPAVRQSRNRVGRGLEAILGIAVQNTGFGVWCLELGV